MGETLQLTKRLLNSQVLLHVGFWVITFTIFYWAINFYTGDINQRIIQTGLTAYFFFLLCVYTGRWLSKTWFLKKKLITFLIYVIFVSVALILLGGLLVQYYYHLNNRSFTSFLLSVSPLFILSLVIGIIIKIVRATLQEQIIEAKIHTEQSRSELNLLQSQLSPHFLFNTLNNMYGISITQHDKIPELLLKLAELLRYSVYDAREWWVPLNSEIAYINNYLDFEQIRIGERLFLSTSIEEVPDPEKKIAPMLLIVFIENAFKHANNTADQRIIVDISLKTWGDSILFSVKNSFDGSLKENNLMNKTSGLGLENVTKRLELLYPQKYNLKIKSEESLYSVQLQLNIK